MTLTAGSTLANYRITAELGAGGMGEVWRAKDTKLGREVALKVLPEEFAQDPERMARFEREAKVLASLNHPNIATLYGLESIPVIPSELGESRDPPKPESDSSTQRAPANSGGPSTPASPGDASAQDDRKVVTFLALELVEGEDLSERIKRGAVPVEEAVAIALQIAEALEAAHEQGIVHRDLKPANIKIDQNGSIKVLDFGLAKAWESETGDLNSSLSPTVTHATAAGVILGTAAYMSPEQARGQSVDRRADIWSFGVVVWEMLTGRKLFEGETVTDVLASVLKEKPDLDALPDATPPLLRRLIDRCLQKEPRNRLQWIGDARLDLAEAVEFPSDQRSTAVPSDTPKKTLVPRLGWVAAAAALILAGFVGFRPPPAADAPLTRFSLSVGTDQQLAFVGLPIVGLSPEGRTLAFTATNLDLGLNMIYLRRMQENEIWPVAGTEGGSNPFFSPDGASLAFFADGKLKKIPVEGGSVVTLADTPNSRGGVWLPDNTILYSPEYSAGLWRVAASGGQPEPFVDIDPEKGERTFRFPDVHPDGRTLLFTVGVADSPNNYEDATIVAYSLENGERSVLVDGANIARFVGEDKLVYWKAGKLFATAFDPKRRQTVGVPMAVIDDVGGDPSSGAGYFAVSVSGAIAWVSGAVTESNTVLTMVRPDGTMQRLPLDPRGFHQPRISPDGKRVAVTVGRGQYGVDGDVWLYSLDTGAFSRFTFDGNSTYPLWTPDGRSVAYLDYSDDSGISIKTADGSGPAVSLTPPDSSPVFPDSFAPDGRTLAFTLIGATADIYLVTAGEEARLFEKDASGPAISPDGRWIAYTYPGSGSGDPKLYVRPIEGEGKWQVSSAGGAHARWSGDGSKLYFIKIDTPRRPLMVVDVELGETFRAGPPRMVAEDLGSRFNTTTAPAVNWDVSPADGSFIFVEFDRDEQASAQVEVAINWAQNLELEPR